METKTLTDRISDIGEGPRRAAKRLATGAALAGALAFGVYACDEGPTDLDECETCVVEREGETVTDTVVVTDTVTQVDTVYQDTGSVQVDTVELDRFLATIPFDTEQYRTATLCPPEIWNGDQAQLRFDLRIEDELGGLDYEFQPVPFSKGCPEFKVANLPETQAVGYVLNGVVVDHAEPGSKIDGVLVEGVYITPVAGPDMSPGSVDPEAPNYIGNGGGWKVQFSRWEANDPGPFVRGSRDGQFDWVLEDKITGQTYSSETSHEQFIPFSDVEGYVTGVRPVFHEDQSLWIEEQFDEREAARDFILDYVTTINDELGR